MSKHNEVKREYCARIMADKDPIKGLYFRLKGGLEWLEVKSPIRLWDCEIDYAYNPEPEVTANGYTFRAPITEAPKDGTTVFAPNLAIAELSEAWTYIESSAIESSAIENLLHRRQLFLHKEDAIACAKAQIALTGGEVDGE